MLLPGAVERFTMDIPAVLGSRSLTM